MSFSFSFSPSDFLGAIELVGVVVDALRSSGNASVEYRELVCQLLSLESALIQVKRLEVGEEMYGEVIALRQAAAQCQRTIDAFWEKVGKYQPALAGSRSSSKLKDGWMKIKWALCKKDDVANFKADLKGHTESIQLLLATVQMRKTSLDDNRQEDRQKSLAGRLQEGYFSVMQRLMVVVRQGKQLLDMTSSILRTNVEIFQAVLQIQQMVTKIPSQVERQQPVYMIDALGTHSPFHLEFVRSAEALLAVLKVNFGKNSNGAELIERGEFAIEDAITRRDIDLSTDWERCFSPGQRVEMSVVVTRIHWYWTDMKCLRCPAWRPTTLMLGSTYCPSCGSLYARSVDQNEEAKSAVGDGFPRNTRAEIPGSSTKALEAAMDIKAFTLLPQITLDREERVHFGLYQNVRVRFAKHQNTTAPRELCARTEMRKCKYCIYCFRSYGERRRHEEAHENWKTRIYRPIRRRVRSTKASKQHNTLLEGGIV
ncbi:hypothetical protein N431DRAFT_436561 [Stipitochalara longipes BDJ]|nr:hypothetical protein N431DRAFT_436561 [Stipitochalara longipes BDJ]